MQSALIFSLDEDVLHAHLFDTVEGRYRFLASSSVAGWAHSSETVPELALAAATDIEAVTGRTLFSRGRPLIPGTSDGNGVDSIAALCAPRGRLRVAVVGAERELAFDSGARAVEGAGHEAHHILCVDRRDARSADALYESTRLLLRSEPDVVLVAASESGRGDEELGLVGAALGASATVAGPPSPSVLFAGSERQEAAFRQALGVGATIERVPLLRPSPEEENLEDAKTALCRLHLSVWSATVPEFRRFSAWLGTAPVHRDLALGRSLRFLASAHALPVHAVDLNRLGVGFFEATPSAYASFRTWRQPEWEHLVEWLGRESYAVELEAALANLFVRPACVPVSASEVAYEGALLRHLCRATLDDPRQPVPEITVSGGTSLVVGTGEACAFAGTHADAALLLLDSLQPSGVGSLLWDGDGLLAPIGVLCESQPRLAAELLLGDALTRLGSFVAPIGNFRSGVRAIEVEATFPDRSLVRVEVSGGELESLPVAPGDHAVLEVRSSNNLDSGGHLGRKTRLEPEGTLLGVVFDARGRPLSVPTDEQALQAAASQWRRAIDAGETVEVTQ